MVARNRLITKYGNTFVITLKPIDMVDMGLGIGDMLDVSDCNITKLKKVKKQ